MKQRMPFAQRQRPDASRSLFAALSLSLLAHFPLVILIAALSPVDEDGFESTHFDARNALVIDVVEEKDPEEPEEPQEKLQFVSLDAPEKEEEPKEAKYADQFASSADEEMVRKALPGAAARPAPAVPRPPQAPSEASDSETPPDEPTEDEAKELSEQADEVVEEDGVVLRDQNARPKAKDVLSPQALFPELSSPEASEMVGEGGSPDYLRDVAEGDKTLLNRKRSRYWAFFDRVKRQVSKEWSPVPEYRRRDPYGNVYGVKDRYSAVHVTLNPDGTVRRLYLSKDSGLDFYDEEAIRAIRQAAPFHNPPEGLKDEDGLVTFTFGFFFEIGTGEFRFIRMFN